ncbi:MAG: SprB repeat-containing protein, partial [Cyclobacteriaceae bacterium]
VSVNSSRSVNRNVGSNTNALSLFPGIYEVEIENAGVNNCSEIFYFEIPEPTAVMSVTTPNASRKTAPSCLGGNDGTVRVPVSRRGNYNGTYDVRYSLSGAVNKNNIGADLNGANELVIGSLPAGNYNLTVQDICTTDPKSVAFTLNDGTAIQQINFNSATDQVNPSCLASPNGSYRLQVSPVAGAQYTYYLKAGGSTIRTIGPTTSGSVNLTGLTGAVEYTVDVNIDLCSDIPAIARFTLNEPSDVNSAITIANTIGIDCPGGAPVGAVYLNNVVKSSGSIDIDYTISGAHLGSNLTGTITASGNNVLLRNGLGAGDYSVVLRDACKNDKIIPLSGLSTFSIEEPAPISLAAISDKQVSCYDEATDVRLTVGGGATNFNVLVRKNGSNYQTLNNRTGTFTDLTGLGVGNYEVILTNAAPGCSDTDSETFSIIAGSATSVVSAAITRKNLSCFESSDGTLNVTVSGGVQNAGSGYYIVSLLDGSDNIVAFDVTVGNNVPSLSSPVLNPDGSVSYQISDLSANIDYKVRVTDFNLPLSCTPAPFARDTDGATLRLSQPDRLNIPLADFSFFSGAVEYPSGGGDAYARCRGEENISYQVIISGGTPPYKVELFRKEQDTDPFPDLPIASQSGIMISQHTFSNLGSGYYKVTIDDSNNCPGDAIGFRIIESAQPISVDIDILEQLNGYNIVCNEEANGQITLSANGGTGPYTFRLEADGATVNSFTGATLRSFNSLKAKTAGGETIIYKAYVTDVLGCPWVPDSESDREITLSEPDEVVLNYSFLSATTSDLEILCKGDDATINFTTTGGFSDNGYTLSVSGDVTIPSITDGAGTFELDLPAGSYSFQVRDELDCSSSTVDIILREPAAPVSIASFAITPPVCIGGDDGVIILTAQGGTPDSDVAQAYTFEIKTSQQSEIEFTETRQGTSATYLRPANDLLSQAYDIRVTDANGCAKIFRYDMPPNPSPLTLEVTDVQSPSCNGGNDGTITVNVTNAAFTVSSPLTYRIDGGHFTTPQSFTAATTSFTYSDLEGERTGVANYRVWVVDDNNCSDLFGQLAENISIPNIEEVNISLVKSTRPSCWNNTDGSLLIEISGGVAPYLVSFEGGSFVSVNTVTNRFFVPDLSSGTYNFEIRDQNYTPSQPACFTAADFVVGAGRVFEFNTTTEDVSCFGGNDGSIQITPDIGNADESYDPDRFSGTWYKNVPFGEVISTEESLENLTAGSYFLQAEYFLDSIACDTLYNYTISQPASPFIIASLNVRPSGCGTSDEGSILLAVSGGYPAQLNYYRIDGGPWNVFGRAGTITAIVNNISTGDHLLEVGQAGNPTDGFECTDSRAFTVKTTKFSIDGAVESPVICHGGLARIALSSDESDVEYALVGNTFG